ncbi:hypothetical protein Pint_33920 [Pistacia integerrima]|uniref:Uncharacterized protein n=1 Tax=Pistacia integerrima TaxID=434235 RepID=A0ACC0X6B2_9ROSI|nr:hypothetical protein Pint_33920 [Pistacia integerrima]
MGPRNTPLPPPEEYCDDDFHWSDASNYDESSNGFAGAAGNDDGEASDNDGGDGREERAETSNNEGEVGAETRGHLSDYEKNNDDFMEGGLVRMRMQHFIGIDGCHLKGHYGGVLLSAISMDANSGIFPLAICVCEAENNDSWGFFLGLLHDFLGDIEHVTFMSDRKNFPGVHLRKLFWAMSKATNRPDFVKAMGSVKDVDEGAYKWLLENEPNQWSRHAFDTTAKLDHITNNMSECFNSWLDEDRELPILSLLELYRHRVMKQLQCRLKAGTEWITPLPPVIHRKINKMIEATRNVKVRYPGCDEFEVDDENVNPCKTHVLVLGKQLCDCGMWQLSGIPCVHAIACLLHKNISNYDHYVDPKLRILMYLQTYAYMVHPVPDKTSWPEVSDEYIWPPYRQPKVGDLRNQEGEI